MAATYHIDSYDLATMGFEVKEVSGIYTVPERKGPTEVNPELRNGVDALSGSNDYFIKERKIDIDCYLRVANVDEALTKLAALQTLLYTPGTRTVTISYTTESYICYCTDGCVVIRLNKVIDNPIVYTVKIQLVEINPARFVI